MDISPRATFNVKRIPYLFSPSNVAVSVAYDAGYIFYKVTAVDLSKSTLKNLSVEDFFSYQREIYYFLLPWNIAVSVASDTGYIFYKVTIIDLSELTLRINIEREFIYF